MALRYVEANALRAKLAERAQEWRWGSLWVRLHGPPEQRAMLGPLPIALPEDWTTLVNELQPDPELNQVRRAVVRGSPLGQPSWVERVVTLLGLQGTQRPRGRPRKPDQADGNGIAVAVNSPDTFSFSLTPFPFLFLFLFLRFRRWPVSWSFRP
jgi:hypothetical protein